MKERHLYEEDEGTEERGEKEKAKEVKRSNMQALSIGMCVKGRGGN